MRLRFSGVLGRLDGNVELRYLTLPRAEHARIVQVALLDLLGHLEEAQWVIGVGRLEDTGKPNRIETVGRIAGNRRAHAADARAGDLLGQHLALDGAAELIEDR